MASNVQYKLPLFLIVISSIAMEVTFSLTTTTIHTVDEDDTFSPFISVHIAWIISVGVLLCLCASCLISLVIWQAYYVVKTRKELNERMQEMTIQIDKIQSVDLPDSDGPSPDQNSTLDTSPKLVYQSDSNPTSTDDHDRGHGERVDRKQELP